MINGKTLDATNPEWPIANTVFEQASAEDLSILQLVVSCWLKNCGRFCCYCMRLSMRFMSTGKVGWGWAVWWFVALPTEVRTFFAEDVLRLVQGMAKGIVLIIAVNHNTLARKNCEESPDNQTCAKHFREPSFGSLHAMVYQCFSSFFRIYESFLISAFFLMVRSCKFSNFRLDSGIGIARSEILSIFPATLGTT